MNRATNDRPALRFTAEVMEQFRDRVPAAEIGRRLDLSTSTISRDRKDISILDWSFAEGLILARGDEFVGRHVIDFINGGRAGSGLASAERFADDMAKEMRATAELHATVLLAQADGGLDARERAKIRATIIDRQNTDAAILRDLDAMDAREGVRS